MLTIDHPRDCTPETAPETAYVLSVIFDRFLGIPYRTRPVDGNVFRLSADDDATITLPSVFLSAYAGEGAEALIDGMAAEPWDSTESGLDIALVEPSVPVLFGAPSFEQTERHIRLGIDIFGAIFFMLSRYEEILPGERHDAHGRFLAKGSMAYRQGFLMRPIVDEYVEILWAAMQSLWPRLERKRRQATVTPTHDVDIPYLGLALDSGKRLLQRCAGDLLKRRSPALAVRTVRSWLHARSGLSKSASGERFTPYQSDPYDVFDWFMELSERRGVQSRFYFMTDHQPDHRYGGGYDIDTPPIEQLIRRLAARGHEIGIHPTGDSADERAAMLGQSRRFSKTLASLGIKQDLWGGRHHYLRWRAGETPRFWQDAGLDYDSTLGYAEHVGFRAGTCHAFPLWDHRAREPLDVEERPLILMECSLLDGAYMGQGLEEAAATIRRLQEVVRVVRGNFVFLWHNSALMTASDRDLYRLCLDL